MRQRLLYCSPLLISNILIYWTADAFWFCDRVGFLQKDSTSQDERRMRVTVLYVLPLHSVKVRPCGHISWSELMGMQVSVQQLPENCEPHSAQHNARTFINGRFSHWRLKPWGQSRWCGPWMHRWHSCFTWHRAFLPPVSCRKQAKGKDADVDTFTSQKCGEEPSSHIQPAERTGCIGLRMKLWWEQGLGNYISPLNNE